MGLKILHSADWHLDSPFGGFSEGERAFLRREQRKIPEKIAQACHREGCDLVLLAGDLFDGNPSRETVELVYDALERYGVPVFISPGNHDYCCPGSPWLEEKWPENVHIFTGGLESVAVPELDCRVYGAGYQSMDCPALLENFRAEGPERYQIGVLHSDPTVANSPYCPITVYQMLYSGLDYLALGHIHKARAFSRSRPLAAWPGCPMGRGWDETGDKGVFIVTLEDSAQIRTVSLDAVCFYELEAEVENLEKLLPAAGNENFYRVTVTGCGPVDVAALEAKFSQFPHLAFVDKTEAPVDLWKDAGEDTLRGVYFRLLRELSEEEPNAVLAAEISRKLLEGREVKLP